MRYLVEGSYQVPEWFHIEVDEAEDDIEAEEKALAELKLTAPEEAIEFEVTDVRVIG